MAGIVALAFLILLAALAQATVEPPRPLRRARPARAIRLGRLETGRCPYCFTGVGALRQVCGSCGAAHHPECFAETGRCAIYGCNGRPRLSAIARGADVWRHVQAVD